MNAPFSLFTRNTEAHQSLPMLHSNNLFALGREIRIIVKPDRVSDSDAVVLAKDIAKRIEAELEYPGQIKVSVIRETRTVDYAK